MTGVLLALGAAATFGVLTPAAKGALAGVGPVRGAGLTYLAAATVAFATVGVRRIAGWPRIGRGVGKGDLPRLLGMTVLGGVLGPAAFFTGVSRVAAHAAAVVQHLEFGFTVLAAVIVLGERPGRRGAIGLALVGTGVVVLTLLGVETDGASGAWRAGISLILAACAAWAADNTLARGVSDLDPSVVVSIKGLVAGSVLTVAAADGRWPAGLASWGLLFLAGGVGVGVSLVLELLAVRRIGATLNAGLFATGPAFAFVWSLVFLGERSGPAGWVALALCVVGAAALATDQHGHAHAHPALRHTHRHGHRDGHHDHDHGPEFDRATEHVHEHDHDAVRHAHDHLHDEHHRHRHGASPVS